MSVWAYVRDEAVARYLTFRPYVNGFLILRCLILCFGYIDFSSDAGGGRGSGGGAGDSGSRTTAAAGPPYGLFKRRTAGRPTRYVQSGLPHRK